MGASENMDLGGGFTAAADYTAAQYSLMTIDATGRTVTQVTAETDAVIGILQNAPNAGEPATVLTQGYTRAIAGAAITKGDRLKADATAGRVAKFTVATDGHDHGATSTTDNLPPDASLTEMVGIALMDAVDGETFPIWLRPQVF